MYNIEGNELLICILDNFLDYQQSHQHVHLKKKKPVLQYSNPKVLFLFWKLPHTENSRIKPLTCFKHQTNKTAVPLFWESVLLVNQAFKHL